MSYLLDTNVISELRLDEPAPGVWAWAASVPEDDVYLSVVTIAELHRGARRLAAGRRRDQLETWLRTDVHDRFRGRILGIDEHTAIACGNLLGEHHLDMKVRRIMDFWLAAIAMQHGLTIVTRNVKDFSRLRVDLLNPWLEDAS